MFTVYRIKNILTGMVYVGQTSLPLEKRVVQHIYKKSTVGKAIRETGIQFFRIDTIALTKTQEEAYALEKHWVDVYQGNSYNIMPGGKNDKEYMNLLGSRCKRTRGKAKHYVWGDDVSHLRGKRRQRAIKEIRQSLMQGR